MAVGGPLLTDGLGLGATGERKPVRRGIGEESDACPITAVCGHRQTSATRYPTGCCRLATSRPEDYITDPQSVSPCYLPPPFSALLPCSSSPESPTATPTPTAEIFPRFDLVELL